MILIETIFNLYILIKVKQKSKFPDSKNFQIDEKAFAFGVKKWRSDLNVDLKKSWKILHKHKPFLSNITLICLMAPSLILKQKLLIKLKWEPKPIDSKKVW